MAGITRPKAKLLRFGDKYRIIFHLRWKTSKLAKAILQEYGILKEKDALPLLLQWNTEFCLQKIYSALFAAPTLCTKH